jgi:hypothetical protein
MTYSRSIEGFQDAAALAAIWRRVRLALESNGAGQTNLATEAEVKPDGQGTVENRLVPITTPAHVCAQVPSRTKAAVAG